jgi:Spy/CpxP family protein refolding chaperone
MMRKLTVALFAVALVCPAVLPASAQERGEGRRHGRHHGGMMREHIAEALGLTEEQRTRIREIREADGEAMRTLHQTVADKRRALEAAMLADPNNQGAIDAASNELAAARTELERHGQAMQQKVYQVFTPEQRERLRAMRAERGDRGDRGERLKRHGARQP